MYVVRNNPSLPAPGFPVGRGLGFFSTGLDLSGWGAAEWLTVIGGVYVLYSVLSTTRRGYGRVRGKVRQRRQRRERRDELLAQRAEIERELRGGRGEVGRRFRPRGGLR